MVVIPVLHQLVNPPAIDRPGVAANGLDPVLEVFLARRAHDEITTDIVDIAIDGDVHSQDQLAHAGVPLRVNQTAYMLQAVRGYRNQLPAASELCL